MGKATISVGEDGVPHVYFTGVYEYSMDDRGRLPLPPRFRPEFRDGLVLTQGTPDACVRVYQNSKFEELAAEIMLEPVTTEAGRVMRRTFFSAAFATELDAQGRVLVPPPLRRWANLSADVVVTGTGDAMEIWNKTDFEATRPAEEQMLSRLWGQGSAGAGAE
jgi:MraZ protein